MSVLATLDSSIMIICSTLLFFGRLGDIIGKSKVFSFGTGALIQAQKFGFSNSYILGVILLAVIMIVLFIGLEKKMQPLLDLGIFKSQRFSMSLICALISFVCIAAYTFLFPFYLQDTFKISPSNA